MGRNTILVFVIALMLLSGCADGGADFCAVADAGLPSLNDADSATRWRDLEAAAESSIRDDVRVLRVVAEQISRLGPDADFERVAALALRPAVAASHLRVVAYTRATCG